MPKIKTRKKKRLSTSAVNFIILFLLVVVLGAGLYSFYFFYLRVKNEEIQTLASSLSVITASPVVQKLATEKLIGAGFYQLGERGITEYNEQHAAVATDSGKPPAPVNIEIIDPKLGDELIIAWQKPDWALYEKVNIYRADTVAGEGKLIAKDQAPSGYFIDTGLENEAIYYYSLESRQGEALSARSQAVLGMPKDQLAPRIPSHIKIEDTKESKIFISWKNPPDEDFAYCRVYRSQAAGLLGELFQDQVKEEKFRDNTVLANEIYYYTITAVDRAGNESPALLYTAPAGNPAPFGPELEEQTEIAEQ